MKQSGPREAAARHQAVSEQTGTMSAIGALAPGDHLCCLYETEDEHRALLTPYLRDGLERGEKVLYIVDAHTADTVLDYLRADGLDVAPYLAGGQLRVQTVDDAYVRDGCFDPDRMIALLWSETALALVEGYSALRVSGEMTWALRGLAGSERLVEYESKLNEVVPKTNLVALCQYDRRRFDPAILLDILATHPKVLVGLAVYDNFYYIPTEQFLGRDRSAATLERWLVNLRVHEETQDQLRKLSHAVEQSPSSVVITDTRGNIEYVNPKFTAVTGYSYEEAIGQNPRILRSGETRPEAYKELWDSVLAGREWQGEFHNKKKSGQLYWESARISPIRNAQGVITQLLAVKEDITERKVMEQEREHAERGLRLLAEASKVLGSSLEYEATIANAAQLVVPGLADWCAVDILAEDGSIARLALVHQDPAKVELALDLQRRHPTDPNAPTGVPNVLRTGEPEFYPDTPDEALVKAAQAEEALRVGRELGMKSAMIVPLTAHGRTLGALTLVSAESGRHYTPADLALAKELAYRAALAVDKARLYRQRQRAEEALRQTRDYLENLFNHANAPIIVWDPTFRITRFNHAFERLTGYTADEVVGRELRALFPDDTREQSLEQIARTLAGEFWQAVEIPIRRKDGTIRIALWNSANISSEDGQTLVATIAQGQDITARKLAEERLSFLAEASRQLGSSLDYETTLDSVAQLAVPHIADWCTVDMLQPDGAIALLSIAHVDPAKVQWAKELRRLYPVDPDAPAGAPKVLRTGQPELYPEITDAMMVAIAKNDEELRLLRAVGYRSVMVVPIQARDQTLGAISFVSSESGRHFGESDLDLSQALARRAGTAIDNARLHREVRRLNEDLAERARELEAANKELEGFSYSVSHDLRAPLRAIDGFSRILLEEQAAELSTEAQRYLQIVCDSTRQMGRLIDDLLAFSRLGRQPLSKQPVLPSVLVRQVLEGLRPEQEGRRVELVTGELPTCFADPSLLKQVYANLLANAVKFTREREVALIEVGCRVEGDEQVFFVRDNGVGFDMHYADKLFGVFQRLHRPEDYEGTGVGLAIVQRIVHRHGGRVWAEAGIGEGATFYFTLGGGTYHG